MKKFIHKLNRSQTAWLASGFLMLTGFSATVAAQDKSAPSRGTVASQTELPNAERLLDEYAEAIGGTALLEKFVTRRSEGTIEIQAAAINGKILLLQAKPNKFSMTIDLPTIGRIANGSDGETVWEDSIVSGNRILEGEEREQLMRRTSINSDAAWREIYESATTIREETLGNRAVWVVQLKPKGSEKLQTNYFDKETKLLLKMKMTVASPMGDIVVDTEFSDYRDVDGLKLPFESKQSLLGQSQNLKMTKVTHDEKIADEAFEPPQKRSGVK